MAARVLFYLPRMTRAVAVADEPPPTRWKAGLFFLKTRVFQAGRALREARGGPRRLRRMPDAGEGVCLAESRTGLYPSQVPAEFALQAGKVQNLRVAAACLDGVLIPKGEVFSFWAHVGRPVRGRGFAAGRELREGCIVPSIGGGLCQLSNALYDAALDAGCEIVERHAHSRLVPGSMAAAGRDATVFWNYVDLRFRPAADCRLEVLLTREELVVRLWGVAGERRSHGAYRTHGTYTTAPVESCETCGATDCFRHPSRPHAGADITAWLVDGWWPEFDLYLQQNRTAGADWLFLPLRGGGFRNYRWAAEGFARVRQAPFETLRRSWASRRLAAQGAERQRALLRFDRELAARYARDLPAAATHLVVTQTLLPHLWRLGALGGRTFDVLMTRLPIPALEATLDHAAARHPQSRTLVDFRAPREVAAAEAAALAEARHWITPHSVIARLAGPRAVKLSWQIPPRSSTTVRDSGAARAILFPASTLARKGACELAAAARELGLRVLLGGPVLDDPGIWRGIETAPAATGLAGAGVVALPAWVEHQPRSLLAAVAAGLPVIAGEGCGLDGVAGIVTVPEGDTAALTEALARCHSGSLHNCSVAPAGALPGLPG